MKTIRMLMALLAIAAFLASCGAQTEQNQNPQQAEQAEQTEQTEYQSLKDKLGVISSLNKETKTFEFVMLPEKHGDPAKKLPVKYANPIVESETIRNASADSLQNDQSVRLSAVSTGTMYEATKIVILGNPQNNQLKLDPNAKIPTQKPKNP